jgi:hypothetical protein
VCAYGAAEEGGLKACFYRNEVTVSGPQRFYEPIFVGERVDDPFAEEKYVAVRAAIVSGPDEAFVRAVANKAFDMRLRMPNSRTKERDTDTAFLQAVVRRVIGADVTKIPLAKQTSITIVRGRCPGQTPCDILVPKELSSFIDDVDFCEQNWKNASDFFEMFKKYMAVVTAGAEVTHQALVLVPNEQALKAYTLP